MEGLPFKMSEGFVHYMTIVGHSAWSAGLRLITYFVHLNSPHLDSSLIGFTLLTKKGAY